MTYIIRLALFAIPEDSENLRCSPKRNDRLGKVKSEIVTQSSGDTHLDSEVRLICQLAIEIIGRVLAFRVQTVLGEVSSELIV